MRKIKGKVMPDEHYNFTYMNSMQADIKGVFSCRGLGKTYGKMAVGLFKKAINRKRVILYLVELNDHLKELCAGDGRLFISQFYDFCEPDRLKMENKCVFYNYQPELPDGEWGLIIELFDLSSYGKAKRTKHNNIDWIVFDEAIEVSNRRNSFKLSKAFISIVESYVRNRKVEVWLFGNMENPTSEFVHLCKLNDENNLGYYYTYTVSGVSFAIHYVDAKREYPNFWKKKMSSTSGKLTTLFDNNLQDNKLSNMDDKYRVSTIGVTHKTNGVGNPRISIRFDDIFFDVWFNLDGTRSYYFLKVEQPYHANYFSTKVKDGGRHAPIMMTDLNNAVIMNKVKCADEYTFACLRLYLKL